MYFLNRYGENPYLEAAIGFYKSNEFKSLFFIQRTIRNYLVIYKQTVGSQKKTYIIIY